MGKVKTEGVADNVSASPKEIVNLRFMEMFLNEVGATKKDLAEKVGISRQSVHHWFEVDDMMLSTACKVIEKMGYTMSFCLETIEGDADQRVIISTVRSENPEGANRLDFLKLEFRRRGLSMIKVAEALDLGQNTVYHWFSIGDCFISYLYRLAELISCRLVIRIVPVSLDRQALVVNTEDALLPRCQVLEEAKSLIESFLCLADLHLRGNKLAGRKARVLSVNIQSTLVEYRKESVAMGKK